MIAGDLRFALRQIARAPLFSGVVIAVIALGIGINAGLLTVLDVYAWRPAPGIPSDARLARLLPAAVGADGGAPSTVRLSYQDVRDLRALRETFTEVAAWRAAWLAADFGGGAEPVSGVFTTADYFRVLRVTLAAGTGFPDAVETSTEPVVVIGHSLWMTHFSGSPDVIGRSIRLGGRAYTIVGVAPPLFVGTDVHRLGTATVWVPLGSGRALVPDAPDGLAGRDDRALQAFARLAPGVDAGDVVRLTAPLAARLVHEGPAAYRGLAIGAERMTGMPGYRSDTAETIIVFLLVAGFVVVITCTNVSALLIGRAAARRREIAVRLALGADRSRIVRLVLAEATVFAAAGATLALALYWTAVRLAYAMSPVIIHGLQPRATTFAFAALFAVITTLAVGLAPALHASRHGVGEVIKNSGSQAAGRARLQAAFVVAQLACSVPVLVVTSLTLAHLRSRFTSATDQPPASVVTMDTELRSPSLAAGALTAAMRDSAARVNRQAYTLALLRVREISGVLGATLAVSAGRATFEVPGAGTADAEIQQVHVSPGYFAVHGIPLSRGRALGEDDDRAGATGVVVNEEAARRLWPGRDPIGQRLVRREREPPAGVAYLNTAEGSPRTLEVIGVAGDLSYQWERSTPMLYVPLANAASLWNATLAARSPGGDAGVLVPAIRAAIRDVDPLMTVKNVATVAEQYRARVHEESLSNAGAFAVGAAALLLASLGLYAIIAFGVAQRTREIGVRLAVGATPGTVVREFLVGGLRVAGIGLAIGLPLTAAAIRAVQSQVALNVRNGAAVLVVVPVLIAVAALASWLPARRAGRVDPLVALRAE